MQKAHTGLGEKEWNGQIRLVLLVGKLLDNVIQRRFSRLIDCVEFLAQSKYRLAANFQPQAEILGRAVFIDHHAQLRQHAQQRRTVLAVERQFFLIIFLYLM